MFRPTLVAVASSFSIFGTPGDTEEATRIGLKAAGR
jgi:hypothetical protein